MLDKIIEKSPAKINLFLKIINKRKDGFHNIRTGVTFINIYDEIIVQKNNKFEVQYIGKFSPKNNIFDDCIINKLFSFIKINPPNLKFLVHKNFPYQAGLGSASSNVATVIKILENLEIIKKKNVFQYASLGSDVPLFLNQKDALVRGKGNLISNMLFPKYYFLLVMPQFKCSTTHMYNLFKAYDFDYNAEFDFEEINDQDTGNDFEKIISRLEPQFKHISEYLKNLKGSIFTRLTGSGSCIYTAFNNKKDLDEAQINFRAKYPNLWSAVAENNLAKLF